MIKHCKKHGDTKFSLRAGTTWYRCNKCATDAVVTARVRKKERLVLALGGKCEACGYSRCINALDFHHPDGVEKLFAISAKMNHAYEYLLGEASKCELLCKNCHAEHHAGM